MTRSVWPVPDSDVEVRDVRGLMRPYAEEQLARSPIAQRPTASSRGTPLTIWPNSAPSDSAFRPTLAGLVAAISGSALPSKRSTASPQASQPVPS